MTLESQRINPVGLMRIPGMRALELRLIQGKNPLESLFESSTK